MSQKRYAGARVEIQIASVLMHAWSEVEHDLVYKPLGGELSRGEYAALDQLNGLVLAGELALDALQRAGQVRVETADRAFSNHYDLAAYLVGRAASIIGQPVTDAGLGRIDLLFLLLHNLHRATPDLLDPYLTLLHGDLEGRPLADQIIDTLIAEDDATLDLYTRIRNEVGAGPNRRGGDEEAQAIGLFMTRWIALESELRRLGRERSVDGRSVPLASILQKLDIGNDEIQWEFDQLRRIRNNLVHGVEIPPDRVLTDASRQLERLIAQLKRYSKEE